jgi:hypothetical protein
LAVYQNGDDLIAIAKSHQFPGQIPGRRKLRYLGGGRHWANLSPLRQKIQTTTETIDRKMCKTDLTDRKPFRIRSDMLQILINYTISRTARHQVGTRFDHWR